MSDDFWTKPADNLLAELTAANAKIAELDSKLIAATESVCVAAKVLLDSKQDKAKIAELVDYLRNEISCSCLHRPMPDEHTRHCNKGNAEKFLTEIGEGTK